MAAPAVRIQGDLLSAEDQKEKTGENTVPLFDKGGLKNFYGNTGRTH